MRRRDILPVFPSAEVAKTRMQLQGELMKSGGTKVYRNVFDVLVKTWRNEGIRGVQRGLGPAVRPVPPQYLTTNTDVRSVFLPGV